MFGDQNLFRRLLQQGADISTTHDFVSWRQVTNLNLLQTTLEALLWKEHDGPLAADRPWKMNLKHRWGQIAIDLLDAGLSCPSDDPRMVKLLQATCFQGDTSWIDRLVEYRVSIDMPTVREMSAVRFYACALHAAAAGGQADVVRYLLNRGARPQELGLSTCVERDPDAFDFSRETREQTALAVAIDESREAAEDHLNGHRYHISDSELEQLVLNYWMTCHVLLEAESNPEDRVMLLELSAMYSELSLVKRLLQMGTRLARVPETKCFETIQLLVGYGLDFDAAQAQKSAIEEGNCRLLNDLSRRWGNLILPDEFAQLATRTMSSGYNEMLDNLVSHYVHDINETFRVRPDKTEKRETLLQIACRVGSRSTIGLLLQKGANFHCPEEGNNAFDSLIERLKKPERRQRNKPVTAWALVQLLERHMSLESTEIAKRVEDQSSASCTYRPRNK